MITASRGVAVIPKRIEKGKSRRTVGNIINLEIETNGGTAVERCRSCVRSCDRD
jgi:hypothetical protein